MMRPMDYPYTRPVMDHAVPIKVIDYLPRPMPVYQLQNLAVHTTTNVHEHYLDTINNINNNLTTKNIDNMTHNIITGEYVEGRNYQMVDHSNAGEETFGLQNLAVHTTTNVHEHYLDTINNINNNKTTKNIDNMTHNIITGEYVEGRNYQMLNHSNAGEETYGLILLI